MEKKSGLNSVELGSMYAPSTKVKKEKALEEITITPASNDALLIEQDGQKMQIPTLNSHLTLKEEHRKLKSEYGRLQQDVVRLTTSLRQVIKTVNEMDEELKGKIDKYEE